MQPHYWLKVSGFFCALALVGMSHARAADAALIAAAKREGVANWYTAQVLNQIARPVADAFEKKYGVKVNPVRGDVSEIVLRITNEAKAGAMQADVFDGTAAAPALKRAGLVMKWQPDAAKTLPQQFVDREGYWIASHLFVILPAFNTELVARGTQPRVWDDLLDPKYRGKIAVSGQIGTSAGAGVVGAVLHDLGEEKGMAFLRRLSEQKVAIIQSSARTVADQVLAGEYAIGLGVFNHQAVISAKLGAPIDWIRWSPAVAVLSVASVTKDAPHPNAGKLLVDFLVSQEGQRMFAEADYIPMSPDVPAKAKDMKPAEGGFSALYMTPEEIDASIGKWSDTFKQIFK
jgi:ABC-type Fe3+ transport system substrate-binding protein